MSDTLFDVTVGHIEDIIMGEYMLFLFYEADTLNLLTKFSVEVKYNWCNIFSEEEFQSTQNSFLDKHYLEFEDSEENKFVYTDIHKEYVS